MEKEELIKMGLIPLGDAMAGRMGGRTKHAPNRLIESEIEEEPAIEVDPNRKIEPEAVAEALRVIANNQKIIIKALNVLLERSGLAPLSFSGRR